MNLSRPTYFTLVAFTLLSWMGALVLALDFPVRVAPRLLWALDVVVITAAWAPHVYFAVALPQSGQMRDTTGSDRREEHSIDQQPGMSPVALAVYPLAICAPLALLLVMWWPDSLPPLACLPVLAIPAVLLAAWVVKYTRPSG